MRRFAHHSRMTRRQFLASAATTSGGLLIGFRTVFALENPVPASSSHPFQAYVRIGADNLVTVLSAHMEGGQGIYAGLATLVAEELEADWSQMRVVGAAGDTKAYGNLALGGTVQGTGGSTGMVSSWQRYREAGAMARTLLINAAAELWRVSPDHVRVEAGVISSRSGEHATFGTLAPLASKLPLPDSVQLKPPSQWKLIGNEALRRPDTSAKSRGEQGYTIDVSLEGMLTAVLKRPPRFGATYLSHDAPPVLAMPGVRDIVVTPRGVAVIATDYWQALKGRDALEVTWDETNAEKRSTATLLQSYRDELDANRGVPFKSSGDVDNTLPQSARALTADFVFPYLAHAAMEPLNAVARFEGGTLEIWAGHQMPDIYQTIAAQLMGIPRDKVKLHVMMTGGFFGRRATPDADVIVEVVSIVREMDEGVPVRVQWTREDDMTGGKYRPMYAHRVEAGLDQNGDVLAWRHHIVGQSILTGTPFEALLVREGIDTTSVEGLEDFPYAVPNLRLSLTTTTIGVPVLWWRSVGHTHTAFAAETVVDDLAHIAGTDPAEYRRKLLHGHPRHLGVLELAVERSDWRTPIGEGRGRGIAVHKSFGSYVAQVAEVTALEGGGFKVDRVVCVVDCGVAVNPDVIRAQMEGSIGFALAAALHGEITLKEGSVGETNFDTYPVLRINEMPQVDVYIVPSAEPPSGVGEPGVPPLAPAVSNAIFAATGIRHRALPFKT